MTSAIDSSPSLTAVADANSAQAAATLKIKAKAKAAGFTLSDYLRRLALESE